MRTLEHMRLRLGMTQRDLANAANTSPAVIISIEKGHRLPRASSIRKIAKALQVDTTELWDAIITARTEETQEGQQ